VTTHELLAHHHVEDAVAEEFEPLVGRLTARCPRAVGEDLTTPPAAEALDDAGKAGVSVVAGVQALFART
jgi:hypothetical protein